MSKITVVVYNGDEKVFAQECTSYLLATKRKGEGFKCSINALSENNMRHLMVACMASAVDILAQKGAEEEDINKFFKKAIDEMFGVESVEYNQLVLHERLQ